MKNTTDELFIYMLKDPKEILKKVKRLEIKTRRLVNEVFSGEYHSVFKGQGIEFSEVREYFPGDDIRSIDWNVTARMGHPFIKKFKEERQLNVMIMVDLSGSLNTGSHDQLKIEYAAELAAVLAFSAIQNKDRVGLILFTDKIEKYLPPQKTKQYGMRIIREILYCKPQGKKTNLGYALEYLMRVTRRRSIVFLISDFLADDFEKQIRMTSRKHDLVALEVRDPCEEHIPEIGIICLEDAETGECDVFNTGSSKNQSLLRDQKSKIDETLRKIFKSNRIDHVLLNSTASYLMPLCKLFKVRERRFR